MPLSNARQTFTTRRPLLGIARMRAARSLAHQLLLTSLPRVAPSKGCNARARSLAARAIVPHWWPRPQAQHPGNSRALAYAESPAAHPIRQVDALCNVGIKIKMWYVQVVHVFCEFLDGILTAYPGIIKFDFITPFVTGETKSFVAPLPLRSA